MVLLANIRTTIFYLLLALFSLFWCVLCLFVAPLLGFSKRYRLIAVYWCRSVLWLAKYVVGVSYQIQGTENIPQQPCVILAKHQSTLETFFLSASFEPLTQVLKKELLSIPFFGWAMSMLKPIAIDRGNPKQALKQVASQGSAALQDNRWVLIFPEGTRVPDGKIGKFSRGGASLAVNNQVGVLPIAHNAGRFWPKDRWAKFPGTVTVKIGPVLHATDTGSAAISELNQRAFEWIARAQYEMDDLDANVWADLNLGDKEASHEPTTLELSAAKD